MRVHKAPLPAEVRRILNLYPSAWLTGTAAAWLAGKREETPPDYDIAIVSPDDFHGFVSNLSQGAYKDWQLNTFGGFKILLPDTNIDVWFDTLERLMSSPHTSYLYNFSNGRYWSAC